MARRQSQNGGEEHGEHAEAAPQRSHSQSRRQEQGNHTGHDKHAGHSVEMFRTRFWVSLVLTIPTLIWSGQVQELLRFSAPDIPGGAWIPATFGTVIYIYGGAVFLKGAYGELRHLRPGMMTLISLAITVAFVFSAAVTLGYPGMELWWELSTLVTIMLLGHWIEMRSIFQAQGALKELARLLPDTALRMVDGDTEEVSVQDLRDGDLILIKPGASIPADGKVREGASSVNEAMITGESKPVKKEQGEKVIAGTLNGDGSLRVEVTGTGSNTALAGIMRLVEEAQGSRSRSQDLADRAAFILTLVAITAGSLTALAWWLLGAPGDFLVARVVTVLVIACPHALGLAIPLVIAISTTLGAQSGLLVRDRRGLEVARLIDTVVFDKTGTLTLGEHRVVSMRTDGMDEGEALRIAGAVEGDSEHPIARAIRDSAAERDVHVAEATGFHATPGFGVQAEVEGATWYVGGPHLLKAQALKLSQDLQKSAQEAAERGQASVYLADEQKVVALFAIADAVRPESAEAIKSLHASGIETAMITGDHHAVADAVGEELGIDKIFAEVLPEDKADMIKKLQHEGKKVAMVGDGVNDAPALVTADLGIAIGAGTDVAVEAGDVVLVRDDPRDVPRIVSLSKGSYRKMLQNLWWAAGYNIVAIPLAAGVLAGQGIIMPPAVGAVLMSASTVVVAINAQLLRRVTL